MAEGEGASLAVGVPAPAALLALGVGEAGSSTPLPAHAVNAVASAMSSRDCVFPSHRKPAGTGSSANCTPHPHWKYLQGGRREGGDESVKYVGSTIQPKSSFPRSYSHSTPTNTHTNTPAYASTHHEEQRETGAPVARAALRRREKGVYV